MIQADPPRRSGFSRGAFAPKILKMADRFRKGRHSHGQNHKKSVLVKVKVKDKVKVKVKVNIKVKVKVKVKDNCVFVSSLIIGYFFSLLSVSFW